MTTLISDVESLFSFEILVENIRLDAGCTLPNDWKPAVALRLLDFPTLVIYQSDTREGLSTSHMKESKEVTFQRGKSCLFKINLDFLLKRLSHTPLYTMVIDVGHQHTPKLIGSSLISLASLMHSIKSDVEKNGIGTPSSHARRGMHDLCNLMGNKIGLISLVYKLVSLGGSLVQHISEDRIHVVGSTLPPDISTTEHDQKPAEVFDGAASTEAMPLGHPDSTNNIDHQNVATAEQELVVPQPEQVTTASTSTQTEQKRKKVNKVHSRIDYEEELSQLLYCPSIDYSSTNETQSEDRNNSPLAVSSLMMPDLDTDDESPPGPAKQPSTAQTAQAGVVDPADSNTQAHATQLRDAIRQLPLLNALLVELSLLSGQTQLQKPLPIHPSLACIYTPAQRPLDTTGHMGLASRTDKDDASPKQKQQWPLSPKQSHSRHKSLTSMTISSVQKQKRTNASKGAPHPDATKPRRKLTYGLTHTYRLRLQTLSSTELPRRRECVELVNLNSPKPPRKRLQNTSTPIRCSALHQDTRIHEHTEIQDTCLAGAQKGPAQTSSHGRLGVSHPSNEKNKPAASLGQKAANTSPMPVKQDKLLPVRAPSALSQHSDHSDLGSLHRPAADPSSHQPIESHTLHDSEDDSDCRRSQQSPSQLPAPSSENMSQGEDYQDDFTSLEPTDDGCSPGPMISPEPCRPARLPHSHPTSSAYSVDESAQTSALPVPVQASSSPQRSLKGTYLLRQSTHTSPALTVSLEDGDFSSGSSSSSDPSQGPSQGSQPGNGASRCPTRSRAEHSDDATYYTGQSEDSFSHHPCRQHSSPESLVTPGPKQGDPGPKGPEGEEEKEEEEQDELGTLGLSRKYQHISDLMVGKLPGYTL